MNTKRILKYPHGYMQMLKNLEVSFGKRDDVYFLKTIVKGKDKRTAAAALFEILALKTRDYIDVCCCWRELIAHAKL